MINSKAIYAVNTRKFFNGAALVVAACFFAGSALAQSVVATVPIGQFGQAVAVNPVTGKAYAMSEAAHTITEMDENGTANVIPLTPNAGGSLFARMAINQITNKIYAVNAADNVVFVLDGQTLSQTSIPVGDAPVAVDVNPRTNKI